MEENNIEVKRLKKIYHEASVEVMAVDDVSFNVKSSEVVAVMGPSGSGKTTLLSIMGCILRPTSGEVIIKGIKTHELNEHSLPEIRNKYIGFIFQAFNLFPALTALENVEVSLNLKGIKGRKAKEEARQLLERVGLKDRVDFLPMDLSGGQKQRVSIARALANRPSIILADEPTGNLDSKTGHSVIELLRDLSIKEKSSVVIVTHDSRIMDMSDRVLYLEDGRLKNGVNSKKG